MGGEDRGAYVVASAPTRDRVYMARRVKDYATRLAITILGLLALLPLVHITISVLVNGASVIARVGLVEFLTSKPNPTNPTNPGGIGPALLGTLILAALSTLIAIPVALNAGIFISEFRGSSLSRTTLLLALLLVEFPTILIGLYVYAMVVEPMSRFTLLAGAIALALVMMPYVVVQVSEALRQVPRELREAAFSLGLSRAKTVYRIILSIARRGILVGVLLGLAKAMGETAPLLFTLYGAFNTYPSSILDPGAAVSLLIYIYAQQPYPGYQSLAWGAALILLTLVGVIVGVSKLVVRRVEV